MAKNFIPVEEAKKILEKVGKDIAENALNAIEEPMTTEETYKFLGYPSRKAFQNDYRKWKHQQSRWENFLLPFRIKSTDKTKR